MSNRPNTKRPSAAGGRKVAASRQAATTSRAPWIIGGVVLVIVVALIAAVALSNDGSSTNEAGTATVADPAALVSQVASVSEDVSSSVGAGSATGLPKAIDAPDLTKGGKPLVLYVGAEYCPFCAAQRWAMVQALSRFGTFTNLTMTHSASDDTFPNTPTFTFHGATYTSDVIAFEGVETSTNQRVALDALTADQQAIVAAQNPKGSIPFIDFGGQYVITGASFSPAVLQGKTAEQVADALSDPGSAIAKGVLGAANTMTATICILTGDQPGDVCSNPAVAAIKAEIVGQ